MLRLLSFYYYGYVASFRVHPMRHDSNTNWIVVESIFLLDMILNFLVEHINEHNNKPVRDLSVIAFSYLKGGFAVDFFTLLPF